MTHPANANLHASQACLDLVEEFEAWFAKAYRDPVGVWTIGWGTTNGGVNGQVVWPGRVITKDQGNEFLRKDIIDAENDVKRLVKVPLNQHQFDALVSVDYNMGATHLADTEFLRQLNKGNYNAVPGLMLRYNTAYNKETGEREVLRGLTRRRVAEGALFTSPDIIISYKPPVAQVHADGSNAGLESSIKADGGYDPVKGAIMKTIQSDTFKTQVLTWSGVAGTVAASIDPITKNPILMGFIGLIAVGLGLALWVKFRDTKKGS